MGARHPLPAPFPYDKERVRAGHYTDACILNAALILDHLVAERYRYAGEFPSVPPKRYGVRGTAVGTLETEMHFVPRRRPWAIVSGVHHALQVIKECGGGVGRAKRGPVRRWLSVEAVPEGTKTREGAPVLVMRGEYRRYGYLETVLLGILARQTRIATETYRLLDAARGKPVFFFPARFDIPETQATDGYAYRVGLEKHNEETGRRVVPYVSTHAQAELWGGQASGTVPHAYLIGFLRDTAEAAVQFARMLPLSVKRIAPVDVNNDCVTDSTRTAVTLFREYERRHRAGDREGAERYRLFGVRLDTPERKTDVSVAPRGAPGVTPRLVRTLRGALDEAPSRLGYRGADREVANRYFRSIRIVATGGFDVRKIRRFERLGVPVDLYGVERAFMEWDGGFLADLMRVKLKGEWVKMAREGRRPQANKDLVPVRLG